jgi:tRNA pseudouridine55 synthase
MLPLCLGEATKVSSFMLESDKYYRVTCKLGVRTDTADAEGEVIETLPVGAYPAERIEAVLARFTGEIAQVPPMYSALKHQGERLYKLAREGIEVERQPRPVTIHALERVRFEGDELELDVHCSKGTYVRTLAEDIGAALGCGAHVGALRRLGVTPFEAETMVALEALERAADEGFEALDALLLPIDTALEHWPAINLDPDSAYYLRQGQAVLSPRAPTSGWVRLYAGDQRFLGVGQILDDGRVAPRRLVQAR